MADVFMGDLSGIKLVDILRLLVFEGKTGKVMLTKGNDVGELEVVEKPKPPGEKVVGREFLKKVDGELAKALGPIASMIVDEQIAEIGEKRDAFPRNKAAELVEAVSSEIADGGKRVRFQRSMLDILRDL